jgi:RNA polymerase sigma-70 factor, ECF subfamily
MEGIGTLSSATAKVEAAYREDGTRLWRALAAFARSEDVASEAMAEAFAQALRRGSDIRDVQGWVWRTAYRLAERELKRRSALSYDDPPDRPDAQSSFSPELESALAWLTPQQRIVIVMHYYLDLPVKEISRRTQLNQLAVRAHLSRGRKRMATYLGSRS